MMQRVCSDTDDSAANVAIHLRECRICVCINAISRSVQRYLEDESLHRNHSSIIRHLRGRSHCRLTVREHSMNK